MVQLNEFLAASRDFFFLAAILSCLLWLAFSYGGALRRFKRLSIGGALRGNEGRILVLVFAFGVVLRLFYLLTFSFNDEPFYIYAAYQVFLGHQPYVDFFFSQPPLDLILTALVFRLFGVGVVQFHLMPFLLSVASLPLMYLLSRRVLGDGAGAVFSTLLFSTSLLLGSLTATNNLYSTMTFMSMLSLWLFLDGVKKERPTLLFFAGIAASMAFWSRLFGILPLACEILFLAWSQRQRSIRPVLHIAGGFIAFSAVVLLFFYSPNFVYQVFLHHSKFPDCYVEGKLIHLLGSAFKELLVWVFGVAGVLAYLFRRPAKKKDSNGSYLILFYLALAFLAVVFVKRPCFFSHVYMHSVILLFPLCVFGGWFIARIPVRFILLVVMAVSLSISACSDSLIDVYSQNQQVITAVSYVQNKTNSGDLIFGSPAVTGVAAILSGRIIPPDGIEFFENRFYADNVSVGYFSNVTKGVACFIDTNYQVSSVVPSSFPASYTKRYEEMVIEITGALNQMNFTSKNVMGNIVVYCRPSTPSS
ncbi:Dolichyl-phosphate-mannose-protein mannosyltransferase [uncultured archaeon]|nr:Dolichyl-phosphate-mannose-protein mannosyltransferase [uncultured archaeon]